MLLLVVLDEGDLLAPPVEGARGVPVPVDVVDPVGLVVVCTWNVGKEIFRKKNLNLQGGPLYWPHQNLAKSNMIHDTPNYSECQTIFIGNL